MTPLGYLLLPVGFACLLLSKKWLYRIFVFTTLFSATSIINFGEEENASALQVWMFFGCVWILRLILERVSTVSFALDRRILRPSLWLIAFLFVALMSLIMPLYINGALAITSPILGDGSRTPLYLSVHNITQYLYLAFGVTIAVCVAHSNLLDRQRHETEKILLLSAIFISAWGLFQLLCNVTGLPYPDAIFNNSSSAAAKGFLQTLDNGVSRITSAAVEPSVLAQSLIAVLPLTLPAWLKRGHLVSRFVDRSASVLFVVVLILCTSSTAYLGLLILAVSSLAAMLRTRHVSITKAVKITVSAVCLASVLVGAAISSLPIARDVVTSLLLDKSSSSSALERLMTIGLAYGYFQKFPVLGIGWGSATSHDLIVKLLSNVGILGTFAFLGAMLCVIRSDWRGLEPLVDSLSISRFVWFQSFIVFLFTSVLIGFPLAFGNFWLILGMAIATGWKTDRAQAPVLSSELV